AGGRPSRPWVQGPVAAPEPLCCQHALVAAVLPGRRLGRRGDPRRAHRRRGRLSPLAMPDAHLTGRTSPCPMAWPQRPAASGEGVTLFPAVRSLPGVPVERLLEGPNEQLGC